MKKQKQINCITNDLMALKLELVQKYGLTYIQATNIILTIKNNVFENDGIEQCDWIEEELKNKK